MSLNSRKLLALVQLGSQLWEVSDMQ
ncbi:UNVERIFIED_CONTAM: hypothetical protein GTU68_062536 [Idotea baltica]|nr:hypothetical protein [Idotea baltica]